MTEINMDNIHTKCDECGDSLVGKGYSCYADEHGVEKTICLLCAQVKALKGEYPYNNGGVKT